MRRGLLCIVLRRNMLNESFRDTSKNNIQFNIQDVIIIFGRVKKKKNEKTLQGPCYYLAVCRKGLRRGAISTLGINVYII